MHITMDIYNEIPHGEVFKVVTTKVQNIHEPMRLQLAFVCIKDKRDPAAPNTWTIYCGKSEMGADYVRRFGNKVKNKENIQAICPCDPDVLALYRY